jgi:phasin
MIDATASLQAAERISAVALIRYLRGTGWSSRPSRVEGIAIFSKRVSGADDPVQFILPEAPAFPDEQRRVADALRTIAQIEGCSIAQMDEKVRQVADRRISSSVHDLPSAYYGDFENPKELQAMAEASVDQARKAFERFLAGTQQTAGSMDERGATVRASAKDISAKAISYAEKNVQTSLDYAQSLLHAKDLTEVMRLHSEYVQSQMRSLAEKASEMGRIIGRAATDASKQKS